MVSNPIYIAIARMRHSLYSTKGYKSHWEVISGIAALFGLPNVSHLALTLVTTDYFDQIIRA